MSLKINVGCGMTPTEGWVNLDNSFSLSLAKLKTCILKLLNDIGVIEKSQYDYMLFSKEQNIVKADATKRLPFGDETVEVLYSSHMLEHLDRGQARAFLQEAFRVLKPGGIIRIAVPDIKAKIDLYLKTGDADELIESMHTCVNKPESLLQRIKYAVIGPRHHHWMYDARSACRLLLSNGFEGAVALAPYKTTISDPGPLNLAERLEESLFVEARKPIQKVR